MQALVIALPSMGPRLGLIWRINARALALASVLAFALGSAPARAEPAAAPVRERAVGLVLAAMNFVGVPYRLGGSDSEGFDCSGFTRHLFQLELGLALPRRSHEQAAAGGLVAIERAALRPGDLVFFNTLQRAFSHVGIYVGEGRFIHSPRAGASVRLEDMRSSYWQRRFDGARRIAGASAAADVVAAAPAPAWPASDDGGR
jgi:cell wall-associated NlpC family hydrolase